MKIKAIITGATGMVGEGVLHECLNHPDVENVLVINRRSCNVQHPKLKEIIGTTSVGKQEEEYYRITFELTKTFADTLVRLSPGMTFCYVSGKGTDSSEKGKIMWARIKGKTENYLLNIGFYRAYMFRPGLIIPTKGLNNTIKLYKILFPIIPLIKIFFPRYICTLKQVGIAMINSVTKGYTGNILEIEDIVELANI